MVTSIQDGPATNSPTLTYTPSSSSKFVKYEAKNNNKTKPTKSPFRPGLLLRLFLEPKSLTREKTFNLFLSQLVLPLLGLLTHLQALDFSRSRACLFCRIRELAIAAAIATTPTTTTSFAAPFWLCLLRPLLRRLSAVLRLCRLWRFSLSSPRRDFSAQGLQPWGELSMPSELLWQWSRSRAGCGIRAAGFLGRAYATAPGRDRGRDWPTEAELRDCMRSAPAPRGHCASPDGSGRSLAAPPSPGPVPRGGG